ncbi:hypothetical protein RD792_007719 [Penstemon davidsonii]|uniref:SUI1 domain-containing protein n=1 Tax=Penstemon davidsonii TaxID=160366 RepID=A0ABR0D764_9LAMI|nr:hypothetical protein RD792_007719 [Penstemon davidsonii]
MLLILDCGGAGFMGLDIWSETWRKTMQFKASGDCMAWHLTVSAVRSARPLECRIIWCSGWRAWEEVGSGLIFGFPLVRLPKFMSDFEVQIPSAFDPFAEANVENSGAGTKEYVHIRVQQRNGRKSLTTVQGLKKEFSYNKILKDLKKEFCCNGTVVQDPELGQVIQLQGDQRKNVSAFLVQAGIVKKDNIKIHGF